MDKPKPTPAHDGLKKLAWRWKGRENLSPSPWDRGGGMATAIDENMIALDGFALIREYVLRREGKPLCGGTCKK